LVLHESAFASCGHPRAHASRPADWTKVIQSSLGTTSLKEAKKLRTAKDLEWDVRFDECAWKTIPFLSYPLTARG
jgi:hypothetical protein